MSYVADNDTRRLRRKLRFWRVAASVFVVGLIITLFTGGQSVRSAHVARLSVEGIIVEDAARDQALIELADSGARALIVRINSPGGTVVGGEDLLRALDRLRDKMPVVTVMGTLATSGGYMAAIGGDRIFAREGTLTGSIGVIMQTTDVTGLLERVGIVSEAIKSSPLKAQPSPFEPLTEEGRAAAQLVIDDMYGFFVDLVAARRQLNRDEVLQLADGRVYTGRQSLANGLIDEIGGEVEALTWLVGSHNIDPDLPIMDVEIEEEGGLIARIFGGLAKGLSGKSLISNALTLDGLISLWHPELG